MEGLRKGSLFPFPEKGRGEGTVPRRFLHPAGGPGQEGPLSASGGAVLHGFRLPGRDVSSFGIRSLPGRSPSFCKFCLLPDDRWAICPCAPYAVRRTLPESPVEPAMRRGSHRRRAGLLQWSSPVFIHGAAIRCLVPRMQAGMPRQDRRRHDSGTPWKERIFRP